MVRALATWLDNLHLRVDDHRRDPGSPLLEHERRQLEEHLTRTSKAVFDDDPEYREFLRLCSLLNIPGSKDWAAAKEWGDAMPPAVPASEQLTLEMITTNSYNLPGWLRLIADDLERDGALRHPARRRVTVRIPESPAPPVEARDLKRRRA